MSPGSLVAKEALAFAYRLVNAGNKIYVFVFRVGFEVMLALVEKCGNILSFSRGLKQMEHPHDNSAQVTHQQGGSK